MFESVRFRAFVQLNPQEVDDPSQFDARLLAKLRGRYEGVCSKLGYTMPGSLRLQHRSMGRLIVQHFNGHVRFECICTAQACNPAIGLRVRGVVRKVTPAVVMAEVCYAPPGSGRPTPVLVAVLPKNGVELASEVDLNALALDDEVFIEVMGKRFAPRDTRIQVVGRAVASDVPPSTPVHAEQPSAELVDADDADPDEDDDDVVDTDDDDEAEPDEDEQAAASCSGAEDERPVRDEDDELSLAVTQRCLLTDDDASDDDAASSGSGAPTSASGASAAASDVYDFE